MNEKRKLSIEEKDFFCDLIDMICLFGSKIANRIKQLNHDRQNKLESSNNNSISA